MRKNVGKIILALGLDKSNTVTFLFELIEQNRAMKITVTPKR